MAKFDGLLESAAPATSVFSSAFGGVADSLKAKYEESVEQYQREQARYCTEEAQRAERQQLAESLKHVQVGLAVLSGTAAAPSTATAPVEDPVAEAPWLDAPTPSLRSALEQAVRRLSDFDASFTEAPELPALLSGGGGGGGRSGGSGAGDDPFVEAELEVLLSCARAALLFDPSVAEKRFRLVRGKLKESSFWRHYFLHVLRERRLLRLAPLKVRAAPAAAPTPTPTPAPAPTEPTAITIAEPATTAAAATKPPAVAVTEAATTAAAEAEATATPVRVATITVAKAATTAASEDSAREPVQLPAPASKRAALQA
jgi:hypothetical protein